MAGSKTEFDVFLQEQVEKYRGVCVPVRSSLLRRLLVRKLPCRKLHPNPDDEFCRPDIGPNYQIISRYQQGIAEARNRGNREEIEEPLTVEKIRPDGYILLNGHHRWAAAMRMGMKRVPVRIVNVIHEMDVKNMLKNARHDKRIVFDLDEVVFVAQGDEAAERPLVFPLNRVYRERLRRGIPALFHYLKTCGYDIWLYSNRYYSMDYIRWMFLFRYVWVNGIVAGPSGRRAADRVARKRIEALIAKRYPRMIHVDNETVLCVDSPNKAFEEYPIDATPQTWSLKVKAIIQGLEAQQAQS